MEDIISPANAAVLFIKSSDVTAVYLEHGDYGPLRSLKRNIMNLWWRMLLTSDDIYGVDAAILMNPKV